MLPIPGLAELYEKPLAKITFPKENEEEVHLYCRRFQQLVNLRDKSPKKIKKRKKKKSVKDSSNTDQETKKVFKKSVPTLGTVCDVDDDPTLMLPERSTVNKHKWPKMRLPVPAQTVKTPELMPSSSNTVITSKSEAFDLVGSLLGDYKENIISKTAVTAASSSQNSTIGSEMDKFNKRDTIVKSEVIQPHNISINNANVSVGTNNHKESITYKNIIAVSGTQNSAIVSEKDKINITDIRESILKPHDVISTSNGIIPDNSANISLVLQADSSHMDGSDDHSPVNTPHSSNTSLGEPSKKENAAEKKIHVDSGIPLLQTDSSHMGGSDDQSPVSTLYCSNTLLGEPSKKENAAEKKIHIDSGIPLLQADSSHMDGSDDHSPVSTLHCSNTLLEEPSKKENTAEKKIHVDSGIPLLQADSFHMDGSDDQSPVNTPYCLNISLEEPSEKEKAAVKKIDVDSGVPHSNVSLKQAKSIVNKRDPPKKRNITNKSNGLLRSMKLLKSKTSRDGVRRTSMPRKRWVVDSPQEISGSDMTLENDSLLDDEWSDLVIDLPPCDDDEIKQDLPTKQIREVSENSFCKTQDDLPVKQIEAVPENKKSTKTKNKSAVKSTKSKVTVKKSYPSRPRKRKMQESSSNVLSTESLGKETITSEEYEKCRTHEEDKLVEEMSGNIKPVEKETITLDKQRCRTHEEGKLVQKTSMINTKPVGKARVTPDDERERCRSPEEGELIDDDDAEDLVNKNILSLDSIQNKKNEQGPSIRQTLHDRHANDVKAQYPLNNMTQSTEIVASDRLHNKLYQEKTNTHFGDVNTSFKVERNNSIHQGNHLNVNPDEINDNTCSKHNWGMYNENTDKINTPRRELPDERNDHLFDEWNRSGRNSSTKGDRHNVRNTRRDEHYQENVPFNLRSRSRSAERRRYVDIKKSMDHSKGREVNVTNRWNTNTVDRRDRELCTEENMNNCNDRNRNSSNRRNSTEHDRRVDGSISQNEQGIRRNTRSMSRRSQEHCHNQETENWHAPKLMDLVQGTPMGTEAVGTNEKNIQKRPVNKTKKKTKNTASRQAYWEKRRVEQQREKERREYDAKQPCVHYKTYGKCNFGDQCRYSHDVEVDHKKECCKYYVAGACYKGDDCPFIHGDWPCKFFHRMKWCNSENCRFSHAEMSPQMKEIFDARMLYEEQLLLAENTPAVAENSTERIFDTAPEKSEAPPIMIEKTESSNIDKPNETVVNEEPKKIEEFSFPSLYYELP